MSTRRVSILLNRRYPLGLLCAKQIAVVQIVNPFLLFLRTEMMRHYVKHFLVCEREKSLFAVVCQFLAIIG